LPRPVFRKSDRSANAYVPCLLFRDFRRNREGALGGVRRKACLARGTPQGVRKETGVWFADSTCTAVLRQLRLEAFCVFAASTGTLTFFEIVKIG
jgi:hypothetical protein